MDVYAFGKFVSIKYFSKIYRAEIIGASNVPSDGPVILCCNHISNYDPPILGAFTHRIVHYMAKAELFTMPVFKQLLPKIKAFPIKRGSSDKQAMRTAMKLLKDGEVLGLFPEGTRSKTGELGKGMSGVGFFALRSDAVVIPCAIIGPFKLFKKVKVVYGEPIDMTQYREEKVSAEVATEVIMSEIGKLINKHKAL
jgi:1-acyl-sn-glycerol-3-phosphate acyltransferase